MLDRSMINRFMSKVTLSDGCWEWKAGKDAYGYGSFYLNGKTKRAHRIAWHIANDQPPPAHLMVCHRCDNPSCVKPDHLFLGTALDNALDRNSKGRQAKGDKLKIRTGCHGDQHWSIRMPDRLARGSRNGSRTRPERRPRGDSHYSRITPERLARGDRNGSVTHPASRPRGERHSSAVLTEAQVNEIRLTAASKAVTQQRIADRYGVSRSLISAIVNRVVWKHMPADGVAQQAAQLAEAA